MYMNPAQVLEYSIRKEITHSEGLHVRPAHALTRVASQLHSDHGIATLVRNPIHSNEWRDVVQEQKLAIAGFGVLYSAFISQLFLPQSFIEIIVRGKHPVKKMQEALRLYGKLLDDSEMLESGGELPRFMSDYLQPASKLTL